MTTEKPRLLLATVAVLAAVAMPSLAGAQQVQNVAPAVPAKTAKPAPVFERPRSPASLGIHGFSVVLVTGSMTASPNPTESVPEAARKALAEMKDFLPYRRYQLLDAAWILCCGPLTTQV